MFEDDRRFLVQEEDGVQKSYIKIVSDVDSDSVSITTSPANDDDFDVDGFFEKHIGLDWHMSQTRTQRTDLIVGFSVFETFLHLFSIFTHFEGITCIYTYEF